MASTGAQYRTSFTASPDNMFVLEYVLERYLRKAQDGALTSRNDAAKREKTVVVFTAGWAMKFVPLLGRVLNEMLVDGKTTEYDVSHFAIDRRPGGKPIIRDGPVKGP